MRLFVTDDGQRKAETKIRMPEKNKETKTEYPYASSYGNVIELEKEIFQKQTKQFNGHGIW